MTRYLPIAVATLTALCGCGSSREPSPLAFAPELDPRIASILASGTDSLLTEFAYTHGVLTLAGGITALRQSISYRSPEVFEATRARARPYILQIARRLADDFYLDGYLNQLQHQQEWSYETQMHFKALEDRYLGMYLDTAMAPEDRYREAEALLAEFDKIDPLCWSAMSNLAEMAKARDQLGQYDLELQCYRRLLYRVRLMGGTIHLPRTTGIVGYVLGKIASTDSVWTYYEEARRLAYRMRLPSESVFALRLQAALHRQEGRIAQAHALIMEAQEIARTFQGGYFEWDALHSAIELNARIGAWSVVRELLLRARSVQAGFGSTVPENLQGIMAGDLQRIEGVLLIADGEVEAGSQRLAAIEHEVKKRPHREHYAILMEEWGQGLLDAGRAPESLPVLARGYEYAQEMNLPSHQARLAPLLAHALYLSGRPGEAETILSWFQNEAGDDLVTYPREWLRHDLVRIGLARDAGLSRSEIDLEVGRALGHLETILSGLDASEPTYLFLDAAQDLREQIHEILAGDPASSYGFELYWRSLGRRLGEHLDLSEDSDYRLAGMSGMDSGTRQAFRSRATEQQTRLQAGNARHWVYFIGRRHAIRWVASGDRVTREALGTSLGELEDQVRETVTLLGGTSPAGSEGGARLARLLDALGQELIPPANDRDGANLYLISPDRFLTTLPFEALDIDSASGTYLPLLDRSDVAYLRFDGPPVSSPSVHSRGILVADPTPSPELWTRYPTLSGLPNTVDETETLLALSPGSRLLKHEAATKRALLHTWDSAAFIYIAAHFVRDAQLPYLVFLPLAPDPTDPGSAFLELSEIRASDLRNCSLVVLSGCSSGVPYTESGRWGPGLGDAFLDAGVGSVIQTFWSVGDESARARMTEWTRRWAKGASPLVALCAMRRESRRRGDPPSIWAAYSMALGGF